MHKEVHLKRQFVRLEWFSATDCGAFGEKRWFGKFIHRQIFREFKCFLWWKIIKTCKYRFFVCKCGQKINECQMFWLFHRQCQHKHLWQKWAFHRIDLLTQLPHSVMRVKPACGSKIPEFSHKKCPKVAFYASEKYSL